jgi:hypothetical protein
VFKRAAVSAALVLSGAGAIVGAAGAAAHAATPQANLSVPNITITSMNDVKVWGTLTNPSVLGTWGTAVWNMQRGRNYASVGDWYVYNVTTGNHTTAYAQAFTPGVDPLGTYYAYPNSATSVDSNFTQTDIAQNTVTFYIREGSKIGLAVSRSGTTLTFRATASYYNDSLNHGTQGAWQHRPNVHLDIQYLSGKTWKTHAVVSSGKTGTVTIKMTVPAVNTWRVAVGGTSTIWNATSATVKK